MRLHLRRCFDGGSTRRHRDAALTYAPEKHHGIQETGTETGGPAYTCVQTVVEVPYAGNVACAVTEHRRHQSVSVSVALYGDFVKSKSRVALTVPLAVAF
jgi:hypothetical protein